MLRTRSGTKFIFGGALVGFAMGVSGVAVAATASSGFATNGTYLGVSYRNQATVDNSGKQAWTYMDASASVPFGYMGARGRLFRSSGSLCREGATKYNDTTNYTIIGYSGVNTCGAGAYYSYGVSYKYTGSGYSAYYTFSSPTLNF